MSIEKALLNAVIAGRDINPLIRAGLGDENAWHEQREAYRFIRKHVEEYHETPSLESLIRACPTFEAWDAVESFDTMTAKMHERNTKLALRGVLEELVGTDKKPGKWSKLDGYQLLSAFQRELDRIQMDVNARQGAGAVNWARNVENRKARYEERASGDSQETIPLFWQEIDNAVGGFRRKGYVDIEAAMKVGKTTLSRIAGRNANAAGFRVYHAIAEGSKEETEAGLDTVEFHLSNRRIMNGMLDDAQRWAYYQRLEAFKGENRPDYIIKDSSDWPNGLTIEQLEADIDQFEPDVVIIDQFNLMEHGGSDPKDYARTSRRLRLLFARKNVLGVVLTQANGDYVKRRDRAQDEQDSDEVRELRPPRRGDYSDTIAVRQDCTHMIALDTVEWDDPTTGQRQGKGRVAVEISRTGGAGTELDLLWYPDVGEIRPRMPEDGF